VSKSNPAAIDLHPDDPNHSVPVEPNHSVPVEPMRSVPVEPMHSEAVEPMRSAPVEPMHSVPAEPMRSVPGEPMCSDPEAPSHFVPEAPSSDLGHTSNYLPAYNGKFLQACCQNYFSAKDHLQTSARVPSNALNFYWIYSSDLWV
jgi:hypothetical protein